MAYTRYEPLPASWMKVEGSHRFLASLKMKTVCLAKSGCNNSTSDTIYISIYLLMNIVHMHGNLCNGRFIAKRHQVCMSDIKVKLGVIL